VTTALAAADITRPGASFYVPAVRVMQLSKTLPGDGVRDAATPLARDILGNILHVQVTRSSSGPSQYKLTLNNWYLSTAADRAHDADEFTALGARETLVETNPAWPRFKYNDFSLLAFGDRLRIDFRYMLEPVDDAKLRAVAPDDRGWVPMVSGPVTDMRFTFGAADGARLEISGEDDLSMLQDKSPGQKVIEGRGELNMVRAALAKAEYPLRTIAAPLAKYPSFVLDNNQKLCETLQKGQSTYDFIQKLADRLDFEVFLEFADLNDPASPLEFHFEPCRARVLDSPFRLDRERDLLDFAPTIKLVDQYSEVRVDGRHRDPQLARPVNGKSIHTIVADELHGAALTTAGAVRDHFFRGRPNPFTMQNEPNLDPVRANFQAETVIRRKARELLTVDVTTVGQPRLRPGQHVEVTGMRPPFDGFYYVRQVVTTYGGDGLRSKITASRPGMQLPPYDETNVQRPA
jgi:hypothetical protein